VTIRKAISGYSMRKNFRLADANNQNPKDSTTAINSIVDAPWAFAGFGQVIASKRLA
jgi:hypothetical protein